MPSWTSYCERKVGRGSELTDLDDEEPEVIEERRFAGTPRDGAQPVTFRPGVLTG
jgi:hypothetical protein